MLIVSTSSRWRLESTFEALRCVQQVDQPAYVQCLLLFPPEQRRGARGGGAHGDHRAGAQARCAYSDIPHPPTNRGPSIGMCLARRPITVPQ
eukprot:3871574-Pyramimonas_sp.AAC.1